MKTSAGTRTSLLAAAAAALLLGACGRQAHSSADGGGATEDAAVASADGVNAADVARFPDEQPFAREPATLASLATVRLSPTSTDSIVNLVPGVIVTKLAAHADQTLITFTSPKTGEKTLGWIPTSTISAPAAPAPPGGGATPHLATSARDAGPLPVTAVLDAGGGGGGAKKQCTAGKVLAKLPAGDECLVKCKTQKDCPSDTFCAPGVLDNPPGRTARMCFKVSN